MNILVLNGNTDSRKTGLDGSLAGLAERLEGEGHDVKHFMLREMKIADCVGCFGCWVKTPGVCVRKDDMESILRAAVRADRVIFASDFHLHHVSPALKAAMDRFIPMACAYMRINAAGRMGHVPRYDLHYRTLLLMEDAPGLTDEDLSAMSMSTGGLNPGYLGNYRWKVDLEEVRHALNRN